MAVPHRRPVLSISHQRTCLPTHPHFRTDLEFAVRRHPGRLDRAQIRADDLGHGIFVCRIDRPETRSGTDVEDPLGVFKRRRVELTLEEAEHDLVVHVEAIVCPSVRGRRRRDGREVYVPVLFYL